jgi:putative flippase GtrA
MHNILVWLVGWLPAPARRWLNAERLRLAAEFFRFGVVGVAGFITDTVVVYALRGALGLAGAGMVSYLIAATVTWLLNRSWTFRGQGSGAWYVQWFRFLVANLGGFTLNRGAYVLLVATSPVCAAYPVLATGAGAIAGMFVNFGLSRRLVFR